MGSIHRTTRDALFAVTVLLLVAPVWAALTPDEARAWREDLRFMAEQMQEKHKNLYHSIPPQDFSGKVEALNARIPTLTRAEVIVELAKIVAAVGDGHTNIYPTRDPNIGFHTLPVTFTFFGKELYVRAVREPQRSLLGAKVLRIGTLDVDDAYAAVKTMIGHENDGGARYWAQYLLAMPEVLEALHITSRFEDVPLTLSTAAQGEVQVMLHPSEAVEIMAGDTSTLFYRRKGWIDVRDLTPGPDPLWLSKFNVPFRFEHQGSLLYVQINQVSNASNERLAQFAQRPSG